MGKSLLTEDKQKNPGEFTWGLPVLKILLVRGWKYVYCVCGYGWMDKRGDLRRNQFFRILAK
jgi:hypothetical protein